MLHREDKYAERELNVIRLLCNLAHKNIITILGDGKMEWMVRSTSMWMWNYVTAVHFGQTL